MCVNDMDNLEIGGCDAVILAKKYGTPLYVFDTALIRKNCSIYLDTFKSSKTETEVIYASKAFLTLAMCRLINDAGLSLDVVSGGELYTAMKAEFPPERLYFHGNGKTVEELIMALQYDVGTIIVDNPFEIEMLQYLCAELDKRVKVLLRVNPGIEAHTHAYIQTANNDSKFGVSIFSDSICETIRMMDDSYYLDLAGFHYHIGSQILDPSSFVKAIEAMVDFIDRVRKDCHYETKELNLGGGFGVYYSEHDTDLDLEATLLAMVDAVETSCKAKRFPIPKLLIEPGRSIVANAGTTLYKVTATKETYGGRKFVFVDGGMTDNPRTALYDAVYEATLANRMKDVPEETFTVGGKCCESGDILIKSISLPYPQPNDILAVASTGAYNYSMASNYNRIRKPAVVFVENGKSKVVVKRETYEDIIRNDLL
jgi:diaminopimelate decarboxylase